MSAPSIGFIGLGRMGEPIVRCLLAAGHVVVLHDLAPSPVERLVAAGAQDGGGVAGVAARSDVLFSCVPGPPEVEAVLSGPGGALATMRPGGIVVEMSTVSAAMGRRLAADAETAGVGFIDGPLSGGVARAKTGELVMMAGGPAALLDRVRDVVACFAPGIFHLGPAGAGYLAKAINQAVYLSFVASFCEATALGAAGGLDVPVLLDVLRGSVAGDPLMTKWDAHIERDDIRPGFQVGRVLKDLSMAQAACADLAFSAPILDAVIGEFEAVAAAGHRGDDMTALYQMKRAPHG